jgi:hemerythrin-like domain-containing protein
MNTSEVTAVLDIAEQDHQRVLENIQTLKEAVVGLMRPRGNIDLPDALRRLRDSQRFVNGWFITHTEGEERTLFPFLERHNSDGAGVVARLRGEHEEIHRLFDQFSNSLSAAHASKDQLSAKVVNDLLTYGWELWEALDDHACEETEAVHRTAAGVG